MAEPELGGADGESASLRGQGPVFVVGPMGSGTTLMRLVLDSHSRLALAPETGLARLILAHEQVPFWKFGDEWYGRLGLTRDELDAELRAFYGGLYGRFAEQRGAVRWGDKTPFHTWHVPRLARVFPDAVFVGTVRHPGAVALSLRERFGFTWQAGVRHWVRSTTELVYRGSELGDRFLLCRYEDLVGDPEPPLRELFDWLGEPWEDRVLAFHEVHRDRGTDSEVEGRTRSDLPMDTSRIARWTNAVEEPERALLHQQTHALAALLGYDVAVPTPTRSLRAGLPGFRMLATGEDLAALRRCHDGIDWVNRPRPTLENRPMRSQDLRALREAAARADGRRSPATAYGWAARQTPRWLRPVVAALPAPIRDRAREIRREHRYRHA